MLIKVCSVVLILSYCAQIVNCEYDLKIHRQGESIVLDCSTDTK